MWQATTTAIAVSTLVAPLRNQTLPSWIWPPVGKLLACVLVGCWRLCHRHGANKYPRSLESDEDGLTSTDEAIGLELADELQASVHERWFPKAGFSIY